MTEVQETKLMPTAEIAAQKVSVKTQMREMKVETQADSQRYAELSETNTDLNEKYNFFDQVFEENGMKGLRDMTGKVLVPARYQDFCEVYHYDIMRQAPVAAQNAEGKVALVRTDGTGEPLTDFVYDHISNVPWSHLYAAEQGDKIGILTPDGKVIVPCIADSYSEPSNGVSYFEVGEKYGLFTTWGLYVAAEFDELDEKNDLIYVRKGDQWGYVDEEGRFIDEKDEDAVDDACCLAWINFGD